MLEYLHAHEPQVIFRDLKPLNIMLTPKGHICLIDFGIARHFKQEQTKDTAYYYSAGYAPPEQYGQSQTSPRSDIYSLGATLHQMLSGHNPASKPFQFPNVQLMDPLIPLPLAKLITQMLEMNEQARPTSVVEIKAQLEKVFTPSEIEATQRGSIEGETKIGAKWKFTSKKSIAIFSLSGLIIDCIGEILGLAANDRAFGASGVLNVGEGLAVIGVLLFFIGWIDAMIVVIRLKRPGWFALILLGSVIGLVIYLIAGPSYNSPPRRREGSLD